MIRSILTTKSQVVDWFESTGTLHQDTALPLAFDWETTGLNYLSMQPVGVSFCDGKRATYIDLWENDEQQAILEYLATAFRSGLFVAHNAAYDCKCCIKFCGVYPDRIFDTFIAAYLLNENRMSHSLKVLAVQDLGVPADSVDKWEKAAGYGYHSEQFYNYATNDAEWTYRLYLRYAPQLKAENLDYLFNEVEMPFVYVVADMESRGILVDQDRLRDLQRRTESKLIELEDRMFESVGMYVTVQNRMFGEAPERVPPINLKSTQQLVKVLEKKCGLVVPLKKSISKKTGKAEWKKSVDKSCLMQLKGQHPFIDYLADHKKFTKLYTSYIVPAWNLIDSDGRIRPEIGIVRTGRTSCRNPNITQTPNLNKKYPLYNYRSIFIAGNSRKLIGGDYSGQELRVLGEVTQDATMLAAFKEGQDLHLVTANRVFNLGLTGDSLIDGTEAHKQASTKYKAERFKAKNGVNFPVIYGTTEHGISHRLGVSKEEARSWIEAYFELYPDVKKAIDATKDEVKKQGYVCTMMGRRRRFPQYNSVDNFKKSRINRQAFNVKIQGFSADQVKIAAAKLRTVLLQHPEWDSHILMIVHDEIVCDCKDGFSAEVAQATENTMINAVRLSVPFLVDCKVGDCYSELK